ncbi:hypothetical protein OEIGOIKO_07097 [Streptomyces chrestomyceticus JCM 4735]|uniref:Uncharacterized protein n=1 Tax=Streptomyces chrestomyceticus JCM 4735 TaxID=1306181 RepID=A0A7U9L1C3_9ACTN|nr:hypothetical protein [Streptomyces chrestomyceticus]GCD39267.1 hypothetical protein OEIGOIKO_07097 [Streptomyces chrestomyceticus JCM 4735]
MSGAAKPSGVTAAAVELAVWWAVLAALWLVLVSSLDLLECLVGAAAALLGACAARAARRAATQGSAHTGPAEGRQR